jgi:glycosyltransferase involved in cell wall biosynthesis
MRLKVLLVSSYKIKCGIACYTEVLRTLLERDFDVTVAVLDQSLLRRTERHVVRTADAHIKAICAQFKDYDVVNIQWEPGLLGCRGADVVRRGRWLLEAADRLILTTHHVYPYPQSGFHHAWLQARHHGVRSLVTHLIDSSVVRAIYADIRKRARAGNFALVAHTERDRRFFRDVVGIDNVFDHPLSHIQAGWRERLAHDTPPARQELQRRFPNKRTFIGVFGFLAEYKGIVTALRAMKYLDDSCQLLVYGGVHPGQIKQRQSIDPYLQALLGELETKPAGWSERKPAPLLSKVAFLGAPDDYNFAVAIDAVDLCVFPYLEAGGSGSGPVSHAIELGKPTVLTRTSAFIELEKYFPKHFEMIEVGNHIQLAQTIKRLVSAPKSKPPLYYSNETLAALYGDLICGCAGRQFLPPDRLNNAAQRERRLPMAAE